MKFKKKLGPVYFFLAEFRHFWPKKLEFFWEIVFFKCKIRLILLYFSEKFPNFQYQKKKEKRKKLGLSDN
jgi:hypothetical protein